MIDDIITYDKTLFVYLNNLGSHEFDFIWIILSNKLTNIFLYIGAVLLFFKSNNLKSTGILVLLISIMILFTDQTTNLFKDGFSRLRPCHDPFVSDITRLVKESCGGLYGFFSAHASNSFTLAIFFIGIFKKKYKYLIPFFLAIAFSIGYSRIYLGVHYPLDVISGSVYGIFIGSIFYRFWKRLSLFAKN
tara:strand:+ start:106 stop:675 length:570 start_codon:yes stop_codon:yes gene_type:complete